jgi:hypothetical protein
MPLNSKLRASNNTKDETLNQSIRNYSFPTEKNYLLILENLTPTR